MRLKRTTVYPSQHPLVHLTHANSLHTATAVPHIPRQSQTAQAGVAPSHYLFGLAHLAAFLFQLAAALRLAQVRLVRTSVGGRGGACACRARSNGRRKPLVGGWWWCAHQLRITSGCWLGLPLSLIGGEVYILYITRVNSPLGSSCEGAN